jgi:hypothetical protein
MIEAAMTHQPDRLMNAIQRIDAANAHDPNKIADVPGEVLYSRRMTHWLARLYPEASEALQIAARAQHIRRWEVPRNSYPMDRAGYHRWRTGLYSFHAQAAVEILLELGYEQELIDRVQSLLKKQRLKTDLQTQALEDVICVVFLENYFADFAAKHEPEQVIDILRKTWAKMSPIGHDAALKLPMPPEALALITKALGGGE